MSTSWRYRERPARHAQARIIFNGNCRCFAPLRSTSTHSGDRQPESRAWHQHVIKHVGKKKTTRINTRDGNHAYKPISLSAEMCAHANPRRHPHKRANKRTRLLAPHRHKRKRTNHARGTASRELNLPCVHGAVLPVGGASVLRFVPTI